MASAAAVVASSLSFAVASDEATTNGGEEKVGWIYYLIMNKYFAIYMVLVILCLEYAMNKQLKMKPKNAEEEARDKKFHAFNKTDAYLAEDPMSRLILYPCTVLLPFRWLGAWSGACWMSCMIWLLIKIFGVSDPAKYGPL